MRFKRLVSCTLALVLLLGIFASCGKSDADSDNSSVTPTEISFVDSDSVALYRVVSPKNDAESYGSVVSDLIKAFKTKFGAPMKRVTDEEEPGDLFEILIGLTNREASSTAKELFIEKSNGRARDFIICSVDNDIAIYGETAEAINDGIKYFYENFFTGGTVTGPIEYVHNTDSSSFEEVSICGETKLSRFKLIVPIYNLSYIVTLQLDELNAYLLENTGYVFQKTPDRKVANNSTEISRSDIQEYEIIVGNSDRDGVSTFSYAEVDNYEIRIEDKKIYLNGGSPKAIAMAVSEFKKIIEKGTVTSANSIVGDYSEALAGYDKSTYYSLAWGDDFEGTTINETLWEVQWNTPATYTLPADGRKIYRGSSVYKNNYVKDGKLYLDGIRDDKAYYGGLLRTWQKMYYKYGYLEISCLHPKGMGFWNSLWVRSTPQYFTETSADNYWMEVDIDECYGDGTHAFGNTFAHPRTDIKPAPGTVLTHQKNTRYSNDDRGFYMDFHTFGFEWIDDTHVKFTCDGEAYAEHVFTTDAEKEAFSQPVFIMLSLACGTANHGQPTTDPYEWENSNQYITDWVHLYQVEGNSMYRFKGGKYELITD